VDRLLPEFGADAEVVPLGAEQTESVLVTAAQDIGKMGMDWQRYYHQEPPTSRTGNRTFPRGASPDWNVYDRESSAVSRVSCGVLPRSRFLPGPCLLSIYRAAAAS
jgi:hypothetical protein